MKDKAFTLAEIMIVLTVIGVLSAILLPVAINSTPDENVMKFKKANNILGTVIRELVNSDQYYQNGDLGVRADGTIIDGTHDGDYTYFCETFAEILNVKSKSCSSIRNGDSYGHRSSARVGISTNDDNFTKESMKYLDTLCKEITNVGAEIVTADGVNWWQTSPAYTFGIKYHQYHDDVVDTTEYRLFGCKINGKYCYNTTTNIETVYKPFCIDVDGIGIGEDPFGYGIRADGKILLGLRAQEWINKSIQND